ncbi:MAG TPA: response regulator transcription factor [Flammeovirgaceae bacterium]|nr:response regulator transcription factor [Flammeovirgaceae bacterium]
MTNILLVEDDKDIIDLLAIHFCEPDYRLTACTDGREGLEKALAKNFDLAILDINLPSMDGLELCRELRAADLTLPIIMLTARAEEIDKVLGLELGADDYLTKPFSIRELIARVKALLRRSERTSHIQDSKTKVLRYANLTIDLARRKVTLDDKRVDLTPKEFDLLELLASNPGKTYSRERLLSLIWGYEYEGYEGTVNAHINRLRGKIEADAARPQFVLTTWGVGYRFNDEIN